MREALQMSKRFGLHLLAIGRSQRGTKELIRIFCSQAFASQNIEIQTYDMRGRENSNRRLFQTSQRWKTEAFSQFTSCFFDLFRFESHRKSYQQQFHLSFMSLENAKSFYLISDAILDSTHFSGKKLVIVIVQKKFAYQFLVSCKNDWALKCY